MFDEALLACLQRIENRLNSDEYEPGPIKVVGGATGQYVVRTPYNTEAEWCPVYAAGTTGANVAGENARTVLNLASAARASYTAQQFAVGDLTSLKCIFNLTAFTGGTTPTATFRVSSVGADGTVTQLEQAAAANSAFVFDYNIGPGTDSKEFGATIQVDMITTGTPTSVTFSASIIGKGPVSNINSGLIAVSSNDPNISNVSSASSFGLASNGQESNALDGLVFPISVNQIISISDLWQPLGRGANIFVSVTAPAGGSGYMGIAFRRKLERDIPTPPRRQPSTHTAVQSRRGARTFSQGFEAQYPGVNYKHEVLPETEDLPAVGNVEEMPTPAQRVLAKLRNGGR